MSAPTPVATMAGTVCAARAAESLATLLLDLASVCFHAGYGRAQLAKLTFEDLCGIADAHAIPRLALLLLQTQVRDRSDPIDLAALLAVGAST